MGDNEEQIKEAETVEEKRPHLIFDTWVGKWIIHRIPAALAWYWFILRFLNKPLPFGIQLQRECLLIPPSIAWLIILLLGRWLRFLLYPLYILFFPALIAWFVYRLTAKAVSIPVRVTRFAKSGRVVFILLLIIMAGWSTTAAVSNPDARAVASLSAHIATYLLFLQSFRWAANPYKPLTAFFRFCGDKVNSFVRAIFIEPALERPPETREPSVTVCNWALKGISFLRSDEEPLEEGIIGFTRNHIVPMSIYGFMLLYVVLASSFGLALHEIERAWGPQIEGLAASPSLADYLYFSFLSQSTAVPDDIKPVSIFGQIWIVWIVMTGLLLLTVLIAMFTTSVGMHAEGALSDVEDALEREHKRFVEWKELLSIQQTESNDVIHDEFKQLESGKGK